MQNPLDFIKNMSGIKENIENIKKEIAQIVVFGKAGGDVIIIEMDGEFNIRKVKVKEEFFKDLDNNSLEQMLKSAFNDAISKAKEAIKEKTMSSLPFGM